MRKRLIFLPLILLTFLLILWSSIANAQCAWVLWMSTQDVLNKKPERWSIIFAVPDFETCIANLEKSKKETVENLKKIPDLVTSTNEDVNSILW